MIRRYIFILLALTVVIPSPASACGTCTFSIFDQFIPPILFWTILGMAWFVINGLISTLFNQSLPLQPRLLFSLILVIVGYAFGWFAFGPTPAFIFGGISIYLFFKSIFPFGYHWPSLALRRTITAIGVVFLCLGAYGVTRLVNILKTRTEAQFIVEWGTAMAGNAKFETLRNEEPQSLNDYRYIITHTNGYAGSKAALRIAAISNEEADTLLLKEAAKRNQADEFPARHYNAALDTLRARLTMEKKQ